MNIYQKKQLKEFFHKKWNNINEKVFFNTMQNEFSFRWAGKKYKNTFYTKNFFYLKTISISTT